MLYLTSLSASIENAFKVSQKEHNSYPASLEELKNNFREFLRNDLQHYVPTTDDIFIYDPLDEARLTERYMGDSALDDVNQAELLGDAHDSNSRESALERIRATAEKLKECDPKFSTIFDLTIHSVFSRKTKPVDPKTGRIIKAFGGSTSDNIGTIWIANPSGLTERDIAEFLVHELTHNLLFVDELCEPHYDYELVLKPSNFAYSAVRKFKRPADKVLHSIVVAHEILQARQMFLEDKFGPDISLHPPSNQLRHNALLAIEDLKSVQRRAPILHDRALQLLEACREGLLLSA